MINKIKPFDTIIARTPVLPFNFKIKQDEVLSNDILSTALLLSTPSLFNQVKSRSIATEKLDHALHKYLRRASYRCTPYGMFSGYSIGKISDETEFLISDESKWICHAGVDALVYKEIFNTIVKSPDELYFPNTSAFHISESIRYMSVLIDTGKEVLQIKTVETNEAIELLLDAAKNGATKRNLYLELVKLDKTISESEAYSFIDAMIESSLLVSGDECSPYNIGNADTGKKFFSAEWPKSLLQYVRSIDGKCPRCVSKEVVSNFVRTLNFKTASTPIKVDLEKPAQLSISRDDISEIQRLVHFLCKIKRDDANVDLEKFKKIFEERYETQSVPLLEVLDKSYGIGYPVEMSDIDRTSSLLSKINFPKVNNGTQQEIYDKVDTAMLTKLMNCYDSHQDQIQLIDSDFNGINYHSSFNKTVSAVCSFLKNGNILVKAIGGASAINIISRFAQQNDTIASFAREIAEYEDSCAKHEGYLNVDILHIPYGDDANLVIQSENRICASYLSGFNSKPRITLSDLTLSLKNGKFILRNRNDGMIVRCHFSNSYNYLRSKLPVIRFLYDLQNDGITQSMMWTWGSFVRTLPYLPRVQYGKCIISRRTWKINSSEAMNSGHLSMTFFSEFKVKYRLPDTVFLVEGDMEMFLQFSSKHDKLILEKYLKTHSYALLCEDLFTGENSIAQNGNACFANEIVISFKNET